MLVQGYPVLYGLRYIATSCSSFFGGGGKKCPPAATAVFALLAAEKLGREIGRRDDGGKA